MSQVVDRFMERDRMWRHFIRTLVAGMIIAIGFVMRSSAVPYARGQVGGKEPMQRVLATDIGSRVLIIGRLGLPLGEVVTVVGEWSRPKVPKPAVDDPNVRDLGAKYDVLGLNITTVNNKRLDTSARFEWPGFSSLYPAENRADEPKEGDVWEVRGIEVGRYYGIPPAAAVELHRLRGAIQDVRTFGFYTDMRYLSYRVIRAGRKQGRD